MDELDAVKRLNARWNAAYQQRDAGALEEVFAHDWIGLLPDGTTGISRQEMLDRAVTNPPATLEFTQETARLFGSAATVNGRLTAITAEGVHRQQYLRVFVQRDGRWWAVVAQVMPASEVG